MQNGVEATNFVQFANSHRVGNDCNGKDDIKQPDPPCSSRYRSTA